ncbi:hypothetical protein [Arcobacter sp. YIC-310]|uniref:hypothetical protein n=1 Tax=Arcobacter sp. YIC-310 TaxID=3376632 RepID=UPI003C1850AC
MSNEYNVVEEGVITCACGGKVTLKSSVENYTIGGKKPLYLEDLLNAPVACPRSPLSNPCTKVVAISTAGTQTNVSASGKTYLLDTIGFKTDKGRAVILNNPGQTQSKISTPPSLENQVIQKEEISPIKQKEAKKLIEKEKYALYFLRQSQNEYKPLRPTRAFRKTDEKYITKNEPLDIKDNIYVHTFAYLYVKQNNKIKEYKILSKGSFYNESLKDIYFEDSKSKVKYDYIPIYEDTKIDISYSNVKLEEEKDIKKLQKLSINPKEGNKEKAFYIKDIKGIDQRSISKKELEIQKKFVPNKEGKLKRINVLCIIEDILAEIEDMYEEYYKNYKLAYAHNHSIIEDVKKQNLYTYTISNMVDYFYFSKDEAQSYKMSIKKLKDIYNKMISLLLSDKELLDILLKDIDISKILEKDKDKVAQSYFQQIQFLKKDFFNDSYMNNNSIFYSKLNFRTANKYMYLSNSEAKKNKRHILNMSRMGIKLLEFNSSNDDYTQIKTNASYVLAHILFSLVYSEAFEEELKSISIYERLNSLRNDFLMKLRGVSPKPNISDASIKDIRETVEDQTIYHDMIVKAENLRDKFLEEYENLDYIKSIKSFEQKGEKVSFKSKYIYCKNLNYYKSSIKKPSNLIKEIGEKLKASELKKLLKIYENIEKTDKLNYVISAKNIIYLLSAPRVYLDQESDINSFFNDELSHIYEFVVDMTKKKIALDEKEKETLRFEYKISEVYSSMQIKLILNDIIFSNSKKKALKFIEEFKISKNTEIREDISYKYIHDQDQNIKTQQRQYYESLKNIEGITSNIDKILEKIENKLPERRTISQNSLVYLSSGLKTYGNLIAIAKVTDYLFFDDSKKNIKTHIGFVNDLTAVTISLGSLVKKYPKVPMKVLESFLKTNSVKQISLSSKRLLTFIQQKVVAKVAVITIIITTAFDIVKLYKREDYDALVVTTALAGVGLALLLTMPLVPAVILGAIISIIGGLILNEIIDSDLDIYLKKSLLYKTIEFSIWKNFRGIEQEKKYQAPYLFEITNEKKELKAISSDGFNNPKRLVQFIGENYKGNEKYFDTSLKNELSFFKSSLFGYKLEETEFNSHQRVRTVSGMEISFYVQRALKIPKILADDKEFKLFFSPYGDEYLEISKTLLALTDNIFDFFPKEIPYIHLNQFSHNIKKQNHKSYIVVISSQIEFKYEVEFKDIDKITPNCRIDIEELKQISFSIKDEELLKGKI